MRTPLRASVGVLAAICLIASSACSSSGKDDAKPTPTPLSTVGAADGLGQLTGVNTSSKQPTNSFVITWKPGSAAAQAMESVEAYGVDIISSLPKEDQDAIKAAAAKVSVTVESATAHVGGITSVQLSEALNSDAAQRFIDMIMSSDVVQAVEPNTTMSAAEAPAPHGFRPGTLDGALGQDSSTRPRSPSGDPSDQEDDRGGDVKPASTTPNAPNDEYFHYQGNLGGHDHSIEATTAWSQTTGSGVTVAVIDSGIVAHPDIQDQLLPGYDFISNPNRARDNDGRDDDPTDMGDGVTAGSCGKGVPEEDTYSSYHGSHVSGIIAAKTNNGTGIAGVAPDARIVPIRALGACGGSSTDMADAVVWASGGHVQGVPDNPNPAQVINMSLGGIGACSSYEQQAIDSAVERGSIVVVAAGNDSIDAAGTSPASCQNVVTVGATDASGTRSSYSNYGTTLEVSAPGGDLDDGGILSLSNPADTPADKEPYRFSMGTSQAAPHVAGVIALLKSLNPGLSGQEITSILQNTSQPLTTCDVDSCGSGIINAPAAVAAVSGTDPNQPTPEEPTPEEPAPEQPAPEEPTPEQSPTGSWWDDWFGGGDQDGNEPAPGESPTGSWWDDWFGGDDQ